MLTTLFYALLSLDDTLAHLAGQHSSLFLVVLFIIIFAETGFIVLPFLPGDSLLFIAGAITANAADSQLNIHLLVATLSIAAILGDTVNYHIGRYIGPKIFKRPDSRWLRQENLRKTQEFFDRYGPATIIIGRFIPIVRTFAPFLAGVGQMPYARFLSFNIIGGILWITSLTYSGYFFGNIPWVKNNLTFIVVGIVVVSLLPTVIPYLRSRLK